MNELSDFLKLIADGKKTDPVAVKAKEFEDTIKESVKTDLGSLFSELSSLKKKKEDLIKENPQIVEETLHEVMPLPTPIGLVAPEQQLEPETSTEINIDAIGKYLTDIQPKDFTPSSEYDLVNKKIKFLEQWIGKIQNTGPGSGEVNLRYLDDVKRDTIADGRWLKYSEADKKFVFDEINPYEVVYNTTLVDTATYVVTDSDWYIGVNYAGPVTITLPTSPSSGRVLVIKDESGNASTNPITVVGTVDNDVGGFVLQMDNGGIQMVYRAGWRII